MRRKFIKPNEKVGEKMKIEIDIDIESIVREALKKKQSEEVVSIPVEATNSRSKWEYGRVSGRRRSTEELELHEAERLQSQQSHVDDMEERMKWYENELSINPFSWGKKKK